MQSEIQIRIASSNESDAIASVIRAAFAEHESQYTLEAFAVTTPGSDEIRRRFDEGAIWAAVKNERIVGTVSVAPKDDALYIRSMAILPNEQGGGIGQKLLDAIEKFAFDNGFTKLFLYTTPFLLSAVRLYERNGFEHLGAGDAEEFFGTPWLEMEKKLA